jgi:hypothetical protein
VLAVCSTHWAWQASLQLCPCKHFPHAIPCWFFLLPAGALIWNRTIIEYVLAVDPAPYPSSYSNSSIISRTSPAVARGVMVRPQAVAADDDDDAAMIVLLLLCWIVSK